MPSLQKNASGKKSSKKVIPNKKSSLKTVKPKKLKSSLVAKNTPKKPSFPKKKMNKKQPAMTSFASKKLVKKQPAKQEKQISHTTEKKNQSTDIPKAYNPAEVEENMYRYWVKEDCFSAKESKKEKRFVIPMPPPNVTGTLHLGHAITLTLEDIMIRYHRMLGDETLYIPGTDHAGIATQVVVEKQLQEEGLKKEDLGREKFVEKTWAWKEQSHKVITEQIKKMGSSCDWSKERFTLDQGLSRAVSKIFIDLYKEDLIYKDNYLVNWCPRCQTVLSDLEVNYKEEAGKLWFIRYFVKAADKSVVVATTRPETMLGDTAVAVHPEDKRYKELIGKTLILPIVNREIPIIADESVDMEFGTGAVKITPAHDINDFHVGKKHNLTAITVIGKDGKMSKTTGKFAGLSTEQARENISEYLNNIGNLEEEKDHIHNVGFCDRCNTKIEPYLSKQWFVRMKPLAQETLQALEKENITFVPQRFESIFRNWLLNVHDWCISRQLWWGHQIPAYSCKKCNKIYVEEEAPQKCSCKSKEFVREEDVLDTWFSSAIWPFSILGWPRKTDDLRKYYPATVLETGYDIIFFWVVRMVFMSIHFMKKIPFKTVYLHGLVRDEQGRKMSKSLGNGIDPIEIIQQYGADALRLTLTLGNTPGNDMKFSLSKVEGNRNFVNKLWNASRFILMTTKGRKPYNVLEKQIKTSFKRLPSSAKWIITRINQITKEASDSLEHYNFGEVGSKLYDLTWSEFCDWYIEIAKIKMTPLVEDVLQYGLLTLLKLWHPYIPFVTEKIWSLFEQKKALAMSDWPVYHKELVNEENSTQLQTIFEVIKSIRNLRAEKKIDPQHKIKAVIFAHEKISLIKEHEEMIETLARLQKVKIQKEGTPEPDSLSGLVENIEIYLPLSGLVDKEAEKKKMKAEIEKKEEFIQSIKKNLNNKDFLKKAKKEVIEREKKRLEKEEEHVKSLKEQMKKL